VAGLDIRAFERTASHLQSKLLMMSLDFGRTVSSIFATAAVIAACGGDSSGPGNTDLRVAGTYDTAVTLQQNGCTGITVQRFTTVVAHVPGATTLTLTHAGNTYSGTVQRNGAFATTPKAVGTGAEIHTLTIAGTFSTTAIDATVSADVQRTGSANCQYTVKWAGPKQGEPNVIPGS
jgi:hypothetical protein